ncbi:hypothetical protein LR392_00015 [Arthrobacter sp. AK04]|uniref:hypothetical protein n=1 Tax=Arthrobacter sp. AK04 TaxID=2900048 RepID=UPI001E4245EB|nr:hypothetical protein [Arthrobacter sp. AK04]MCD5340607.1 hypothetical protein [Arthrobacter sp. AK04]
MEQPGLVHFNPVPKPDLFWLTAYALILGTGVLIGVVLAFTPVVLVAMYPGTWFLVTLAAVPLGVWIAVRLVGVGRRLMLRYRHLPEYRLFEDRVESVEWPNPQDKGVRLDKNTAPTRRSVRLDQITSAVASFCIVRETYNRYGQRFTETAPILYIRYRSGGRDELLSIPFPSHWDQGVDMWLSHLSDRGVPLLYTPKALYRHDTQVLDDAGRLRLLDELPNLVPYRFGRGWQADEQDIRARWSAVEQVERDAEEARDPALKSARARHPVTAWIIQMLVFVWLGMTVFLQQLAWAGRPAEPANFIISFAAVLLFGLLFFFLLRSYLRWPYIFIYSGGALLTGFMTVVASTGLSDADQSVAAAFFIATVLFQPLCWVPYLIVKRLSAGSKKREQVAV